MLSERIEQLEGLSQNMLERLLSEGFANLEEVLHYKSYQLLEKGFNFHDLTELVELLDKYGLNGKLED